MRSQLILTSGLFVFGLWAMGTADLSPIPLSFHSQNFNTRRVGHHQRPSIDPANALASPEVPATGQSSISRHLDNASRENRPAKALVSLTTQIPLQPGRAQRIVRAARRRVAIAGQFYSVGALQCTGLDDTKALAEAVKAAQGGWVVIAAGQTCAGTDITIPNLRIEPGGLLKPTTSHNITLAGDFDAGPYQAFTNALSGQGTIMFKGTSLYNLYPQWWGAKANDKTDNASAFMAVKAAWQTAASSDHFLEITFPTGVYRTSAAQNWFANGITLRAQGCVIIKSTTTSDIFEFDAGLVNNGYRAKMLGDFVLDGLGKAQVGLYTRNVHHSEFNVRARNVTAAGLKTEGAVLNQYNVTVTAAGDPNFTLAPRNGVVVDRSSLVSSTVACQFNLVIENATSTGVVLTDATGNTFRGSAEGLGGWGVQISAKSSMNNFDAFFGEENALGDFEVSGSRNHFDNCTGSSIAKKGSLDSIKGIVFKTGAKMNSWVGGYFYAALVEPGADSNQFWAFQSNYKIFDNGTNTAHWGLELYNSAAILPASLPLVPTRAADSELTRLSNGQIGQGTANSPGNSRGIGLPKYANNAAAVAGGLAVGSYYRTGGDPDLVCVVH